MNATLLIDTLERFPAALEALVRDLSLGLARRRPAPGKWSILETVVHLVEEDRLDFGQRLRQTIEDPDASWPGIDPERWVVEKRYNERELGASLDSFCAGRAERVTWLRGLEASAFERVHRRRDFATLSAGDLLASWAVHDSLHLGQIARGLAAVQRAEAAPWDAGYAEPQ